MTRSDMKRAAKQQLGGELFGNSWMLALLACVLFTILMTVAGSVIPVLGATLIIGPLTYGLEYVFLKQARTGEPMRTEELFTGFRDFGSLFILGFLESLFVVLWSLLFVIPGIVKTYAYAQAFKIRVDHPEYDWRQCLEESSHMMRGHKWELFLLDLSFLGWYIVGALCFGVGTLWVVPYHQAAKTQFYLSLCRRCLSE